MYGVIRKLIKKGETSWNTFAVGADKLILKRILKKCHVDVLFGFTLVETEIMRKALRIPEKAGT
jgi:hypothetical protein